MESVTFLPLFAIRTGIAVALIVVICGGILWFIGRVLVDAVTWIREEYFEGISRQQARARKQRQAKEDAGDDRLAGSQH